MKAFLKSIYISLYISANVATLVAALFLARDGGWSSPWMGTALASAGPVLFFVRVFASPVARTSRNLHGVLATAVAGTVASGLLGGTPLSAPVATAFVAAVAGTVVYVYWYSRFPEPAAAVPDPGQALPDFAVVEDGREISSASLTSKPALWVFYRGNWCPVCVAQIREICAQYRRLADRGIEVYFVSPQSEENSAALAERCDAPLRFLTDRDNRAARALGILVEDGIPAGLQALGYDSDAPRPAVFITDSAGRVVFRDLTDNYRVRPEPAQYLPVLEGLAAS